jgi:hypothetical protein
LSRQLEEEAGDGFLARKGTITEDRERRGRYYVIVEFDSYEEAMKNSDNLVVNKYAAKLGELLDGPPIFRNLDVFSVQEVR